MTDSPSTSPIPSQDPAGRPGLAGSLALLQDRLLLQVTPARVSYIRAQIDPHRSGLVVSGEQAAATVGKLRRERFAGPLLADPAVYERAAATEVAPFPELGQSEGQFAFDDPLVAALKDQLDRGASAAMTPTGYLHAEDSEALVAAVRAVRALEDPGVIFTVPIDVGWLRADAVDQLIAVLNLVPGVKAVMLGGQMDPLGRFPSAVANLRRLLAEVPGAALLRTDLAAFGALAHGAAFAAFGATSRVRHIVPPPQKAETSHNGGGPSSPHVLYPDLMDFFLGKTLADRFAAANPPICYCTACGERELDSFASNRHQVPAAAHNAAVLTAWAHMMQAVPRGVERQQWWQQRCQHAVDHHRLLNEELDQPNAFKVPVQLKRWAQLEIPASAPQVGADHGPR